MTKITYLVSALVLLMACDLPAQAQNKDAPQTKESPKKEKNQKAKAKSKKTSKEKPKSWRELAAARFGDNPTEEHKAEINANLPEATNSPDTPRKVLVFYRCDGFIHTSIPFCNFAMQSIGEKTGAFSVDLADTYDVFNTENLAQYDAIIFNNTTHLNPSETQRAAILEFVNSGKGIVGIHAAGDNFGDWPEGVALIGGIFNGHPWKSGGTWAFKLDDSTHPLNAAFDGKGFWHQDEIYWYRPENFEGREKLRVLLSLDMSKSANTAAIEGTDIKDRASSPSEVDVPVSWCREIGEGRLFYTNLGHNDRTFANTVVLQHILDGIQYALGDLDADAMPSTEANATAVPAPDSAE